MPCKKLFFASVVLFVLLSFPLINSVGASSEMWKQVYGGSGADFAHSLVETSDGGYAVAGVTSGPDAWLVKTDVDGNMVWNQEYGGDLEDQAFSLVATSDGGFALAGFTTSSNIGPYIDFLLIKTDEYGYIPEFPSWTIFPIILVIIVSFVLFELERRRQKAKEE